MKKVTFTLALTLLSIHEINAQPTINNAELFEIGEIISIQECDTAGIEEGNSGANQVWDFTRLIPISSPITAKILSPEMVNFDALYPNADRVEKWSNGKYVITSNNVHSSRLEAFIDSVTGINIDYTSPMLFAKRPITYLDTYSENFKTDYSFSGYDFKGVGTVEIKADGYGTLTLPNGTFNNVLRVKMHQVEWDTLIQFGSITKFETFTYLWFDVQHSAALLKVNYVHSDIQSKSVSYLVNQMVGMEDAGSSMDFQVFPNPSDGKVYIKTTAKVSYQIFGMDGSLISAGKISNESKEISMMKYPSGVYYVRVTDELGNITTQTLILS